MHADGVDVTVVDEEPVFEAATLLIACFLEEGEGGGVGGGDVGVEGVE